MSYIEVVGLRAGRGNMGTSGLLHVLFAFGNAIEVVTDADDFRHAAQKSSKRLDHGWRKFDGPLFACDVGRVRVAHEPFNVRVEPHIQTMVLDGLNHFLRHSDW